MPVFYRPGRVIIDDGGSPVAVIAGVAVLAVIVSGAAVLISDLITALLILAIVAVAGSSAVLVVILRRTGMAVAVDHRPKAESERQSPAAMTEPARRAITPTRIVLHGEVVQPSPTERKTP